MRSGSRRRGLDWALAGLLTIASFVTIAPWLFLDLSNQPWNNGHIYAGIVRMFRQHSYSWDSLQYAGAPFHYLYPPIFPFLAAQMSWLPPGKAVHLLAGVAFAFTPACVYALALCLSGFRSAALVAAVAYSALPSPIYLLSAWRNLAVPYGMAPWSFVALVSADEVAHIIALPVALLALVAILRGRFRSAAGLAGCVMLINWPGLIGMGFFLVALFVVSIGRRHPWVRSSIVCSLIACAYGLSAFWMTPGYFASSSLLNRIVLRHTLPNSPWGAGTWLLFLAATLAVLTALRRVPFRLAFPICSCCLTGAVVLSYTWFGNYLIPSPQRYMLEFNLCLILLGSCVISFLPGNFRRFVSIALIALGCIAFVPLQSIARRSLPYPGDPASQVAFQVARRLTPFFPTSGLRTSRVFASGELDGTLNLWSDLPQVGGTGQDISNFLIFAAQRQIALGCETNSGTLSRLWMRALNVRAAVVHQAASREYFHWYSPAIENASLPVLSDDGQGNLIYDVPDSGLSDAVVVDLAQWRGLKPLRSTNDEARLAAYVEWARGKRPVAVSWQGDGAATLNTELADGEGVLVKMNNDRGWRAHGADVDTDPIGFMVLRAPAGRHEIALSFGTQWDGWLAWGISLATVFILIFRRRPGLLLSTLLVAPAFLAYIYLLAKSEPSARISEEAFARVRPPLINPMGIVDGLTGTQPPFGTGRVLAVYGLNFGSETSTVRVWLGENSVTPDYHGPNQIQFRLPATRIAPGTPLRIEVNGCRGNSFALSNLD